MPSLNGRRVPSSRRCRGRRCWPRDGLRLPRVRRRDPRQLLRRQRVERGFLVGTRAVDRLDFRYAQLRADGTTATGHCVSVISRLADGRLRLDETWEWESASGSGTSSVVEIDDGEVVEDVDPEDLSLLDLLR